MPKTLGTDGGQIHLNIRMNDYYLYFFVIHLIGLDVRQKDVRANRELPVGPLHLNSRHGKPLKIYIYL